MNDAWYLGDGTVLTGNDAAEYLKKQLRIYDDLSKEIASCLKECYKLNMIDRSDSLAGSLLDAGERISMIEIEPEMLLREISSVSYSL